MRRGCDSVPGAGRFVVRCQVLIVGSVGWSVVTTTKRIRCSDP
jgi:hypothetical protein